MEFFFWSLIMGGVGSVFGFIMGHEKGKYDAEFYYKPFAEGAIARFNKESEKSCPYSYGTSQWNFWMNGYKAFP